MGVIQSQSQQQREVDPASGRSCLRRKQQQSEEPELREWKDTEAHYFGKKGQMPRTVCELPEKIGPRGFKDGIASLSLCDFKRQTNND